MATTSDASDADEVAVVSLDRATAALVVVAVGRPVERSCEPDVSLSAAAVVHCSS